MTEEIRRAPLMTAHGEAAGVSPPRTVSTGTGDSLTARSATLPSSKLGTPLDEVAREMAEHKYGSTVVMQNGKVVGIFTTVDACRPLADLLHRQAT